MDKQEKQNSLTDEVMNTVKELESSFKLDEDYARFVKFYSELKRLGIPKKQQYNIPPWI